ncbi:hypothetical protein BDY24DRAFT_441499 [Mrakia frigida]|uniref:uncharacterized protein n=1 Tax=Mrakia frigida TaxID=29902 RepID=UPI003FCC0575
MRSILHQTRLSSSCSTSLPLLRPSSITRTLHTTCTALVLDSSSSPPLPSLYKSSGPPPPLRASRSRSPTGPPPLSSLKNRSTSTPIIPSTTTLPPPPTSSSSSSTTTPDQLLALARGHLRLTAPPSYDDLYALQTLYKQTFPTPTTSLASNSLRAEILWLTLARANRSPPPPIKAQRQPLSLTLAFFVASLKKCGPPNFDLESVGINVKQDLVPLVWKLAQRRRIREFVETVHQWNRVDFDGEEVGLINEALEFWKEDRSEKKRVAKGRWVYLDWEEGTGKRLGEWMEKFAKATRGEGEDEGMKQGWKASVAAIQVWVREQQQQQQQVVDPPLFVSYKRSKEISTEAFVRLSNLTPRLLDAPSSSSASPETLELLSDLYHLFHPPSSTSNLQHPPLPWRQQAEVLLPLLLLFGHASSSSSSSSSSLSSLSFTQHLLPLLTHLLLLPPSFLPSTPSYPSLLPSLLPLATTTDESLLVVHAILHAQQDPPPAYLPTIWTAFLGSLALQEEVPEVRKMLGSELFGRVEEVWEEQGGKGEEERAIEEVVQVYLWRCKNVKEEKKGKEILALWELEGVLIEREREKERRRREREEKEEEEGGGGGMMKALRKEVRRVLEENL